MKATLYEALGIPQAASDEEVRAALDRNLCRCGSQNRIVRAVLVAAASLRASRDGASQVSD